MKRRGPQMWVHSAFGHRAKDCMCTSIGVELSSCRVQHAGRVVVCQWCNETALGEVSQNGSTLPRCSDATDTPGL